jgi:hypothetical protein
MNDSAETYATLLGRAAMEVWGDMPRDIQEALFETAMQGREDDREGLARLLHARHPRTLHPVKPD